MPIKHLAVALDMVPAIGGPYTTLQQFRKALGTQILSFTQQKYLGESIAREDGVHPLACEDGLLGKFYNRVPSATLRGVEGFVKEFDLLSCHMIYRHHTHFVRNMAQKHGKPYWVVPHGALDPWVFTYGRAMKLPWMRLYGQRFLRDAQAIIFATERERQKAAPWLSRDNGRVLHWPVTPVSMEGREANRERIRRELGIGERDRVLIFLGRLHHMKRPLRTIRACAQVGDPKLHLLVVGPEEAISQKECAQMAADNGFEHAHVLGALYGKEKLACLHAADAFITLSERENFGHAFAEALSAELPAIVSPGVDLVEDLKSVDCLWRLHDNEAATAAVAITAFLNSPRERLNQMGRTGRDWVCRELSYEKFAQRLKALASEATGIQA